MCQIESSGSFIHHRQYVKCSFPHVKAPFLSLSSSLKETESHVWKMSSILWPLCHKMCSFFSDSYMKCKENESWSFNIIHFGSL